MYSASPPLLHSASAAKVERIHPPGQVIPCWEQGWGFCGMKSWRKPRGRWILEKMGMKRRCGVLPQDVAHSISWAHIAAFVCQQMQQKKQRLNRSWLFASLAVGCTALFWPGTAPFGHGDPDLVAMHTEKVSAALHREGAFVAFVMQLWYELMMSWTSYFYVFQIEVLNIHQEFFVDFQKLVAFSWINSFQ